MLIPFKAVLKQRHYSLLAENKVASSQQTDVREETVGIDAEDQQFLTQCPPCFLE
ncbi:MAG: hypothetical protein JF619_24035 [Massilia sp.]|nr:hypothetical protein [Massilia sp.]